MPVFIMLLLSLNAKAAPVIKKLADWGFFAYLCLPKLTNPFKPMFTDLLNSSYFALFLIVALGFMLGRIKIKGYRSMYRQWFLLPCFSDISELLFLKS